MPEQTSQKSVQGLEQEEEVRQCPECGSKKIAKRGDEIYCERCGLVIE